MTITKTVALFATMRELRVTFTWFNVRSSYLPIE